MTTKLSRHVHLEELTQMKLIKLVLVTPSCQDHVTNLKHYISTTRVPLVILQGYVKN